MLLLGVGWQHGDGHSLRSLIWSQPVLKAGGSLESSSIHCKRMCEKTFVNNGEQTDCPVVLYVWCVALLMQQNQSLHSAMLLELGTVEDICWQSQVRRLTMASQPSCRTPPVMLSSPGALLWSSFFDQSLNFCGQDNGWCIIQHQSMYSCYGSIMSIW